IVRALTVYNGELIAAGNFDNAGGNTCVRGLARWNGSIWQAPGSQCPAFCCSNCAYSLTVDGGKLIAGGCFTDISSAGNRVSQWDGTNWTGIGGAVGDAFSTVF